MRGNFYIMEVVNGFDTSEMSSIQAYNRLRHLLKQQERSILHNNGAWPASCLNNKRNEIQCNGSYLSMAVCLSGTQTQHSPLWGLALTFHL
jgi:hypothetical protein